MKLNTISNCIVLLTNNIAGYFYVALAITLIFIVIALIYFLVVKNKKEGQSDSKKEANRIKYTIIGNAKKEAKKIVEQAKLEKDFLLKKLKTEQEIIELKENELEKLIDENRSTKTQLIKNREHVNKLRDELDQRMNEALEIIKHSSKLTETQAKEKMMDFIKVKYDNFLKEQLEVHELKWKSIAKEKTKSILLNMLSNISTDIIYEGTSNVFKLEVPEDKAKIIGKEGRNLKAIQQILGVDIVLKYSEDEILISSFDPIRRHIASRVIGELLSKKRLQPQSIEEEAIKIKEGLSFEFYEEGLEVANENGIHDFSDNILRLLGSLKYRTSYGQSVLKHSVEVGKISQLIAKELGLDPVLAFKCGILHDIGKAVDKSQEGTHVNLGVDILKAEKISPIIINSVAAHHEDVEKESLYAEIVSIADSISAARPGARNIDLDSFILRMKEVEDTVKGFDGVKEVFALKSGRQIRVMVNPSIVSDIDLAELAVKIKEKLSAINTTPGEIVITLIREKRHVVSF